MGDDQNDELSDDTLGELAARAYRAPEGSVPREEMWTRISAARREARVAPVIEPIRKPRFAAWRWGAALAAGLVLGIMVDRVFVGRDVTSASSSVASAQNDAASVDVTTGPRDQRSGDPVEASPRANADVATTERSRSPIASRNTTDPLPANPRDLYKAAAIQTLVQAEALLTAYRVSGDPSRELARDPQEMQQAARWARDVLSSTRLLMDSPAARDPQLRVLFTDLELILAQIVQLSGAPLQANERALIERALRDRDVIQRLRSAVPAGQATS